MTFRNVIWWNKKEEKKKKKERKRERDKISERFKEILYCCSGGQRNFLMAYLIYIFDF